MTPTLTQVIDVVMSGGPAVVLAVVVWWQRQDIATSRARNEELADKLLDLATAQTEAINKIAPTLSTIQQLLAQLVGRRGDD